MSASDHLSLAQHLQNGQLPMFMTAAEIQQHYSPWGGDVHDEETDSDVWNRKHDESISHMDDGGPVHDEKYDNLAHDIAHRGFENPVIPLQDKNTEGGTPQVLGGHHRIAVAANEHPDYMFPIEHYRDLKDARFGLRERY